MINYKVLWLVKSQVAFTLHSKNIILIKVRAYTLRKLCRKYPQYLFAIYVSLIKEWKVFLLFFTDHTSS